MEQLGESNVKLPKEIERRQKWKRALVDLLEGIKFNRLQRQLSFENLETFQSFNKIPEHLRLEEHIELSHLHELMEEFDNHRPETRIMEGTSKYSATKYEHREPGALNPEEFKETIAGVLGTRRYDEQLDKLFTKLDTSADGFVDWNEFATYMLLHYRENDYLRTKKEIPFVDEPRIKHIVHNRQECTVCIVALDNPLRYLTINKDGAICLWSSTLCLERTTFTDPELEDAAGQKRRFKMWVMDATYMPNCHKVVIASTRRDLRFYDIAGNQMIEDYHLYGLNNVPHCIAYHYNEKDLNGEAMLLWGDEAGDIHILEFKSPVTQLFEKAFTKQATKQSKNRIYMHDLWKHERFVQHTVIESVHKSEPIKRLQYISHNDLIITGSASPKTSVVVIDRKGNKKPYVFKLAKGVQCFDHSKKLNLLVTGAPDHMVRLWNPYVPNKAITVLEGHYSAIVDVVIYESLEQVFSYSADAMLKVWDIKDYMCLQTILVKFPTSLNGHIPEHGSFPLHLNAIVGSPHSCLLIACNDYIAKIKLGLYQKPIDDIPRTHFAPLCGAIFNQFFREVVTAADDSSIMAWDFETGNKNLVFTNAHGDEEITSLAFDGNWRRLITGARNGTVKVWNFQNGHNLHKLEPVEESEVTGVLSLVEKEFMLTVGWSRKITKYDDSEGDNLYIEADDSWKGGTLHKDDILDLAYCPPNLLATASFDAEILVWTLETEKLILRVDAASNTGTKHAGGNRHRRPSTAEESRTSRPNSRHRPSHRPAKGETVPVDKVIFLKSRIDGKLTEAATLISCQAGQLKWWSVFGNKNLLGEFRGTDFPNESVLTMSCDKENTTLVTADTQGFIYTWNIRDYCIRPTAEIVTKRPPIRYLWRGHELAVVSVEFIEHRDGNFILSASSDRTARLWSADGQFIGTFGQKLEWSLSDKSTWIHPLTPFSEEYFLQQIDPTDKSEKQEPEEEEVAESPEVDEEISITPLPELATAIQTLDRAKTEIKPVPVCHRLPARAATVSGDEMAGQAPWLESDSQIKEKARTFHMSQQAPKTTLGVKAQSELLRARLCRQQRRGNYGNIDKEQTNKFGVQCCPFQVLATPEMNNNLLPRHLPVTQRMIQRGYTSASLDEAMLRTMDLSIIIDDEKRTKKQRPRLPTINSRSNTMVSTKP